ncbi:class I SAM-dependent methyltransferase [Fundicoccus culcitae]|uniref:Methyltransferase n=1 Tax=Fundicoccus culcitae TaxID=2969821 RepID=A0ABY5P346_9LACT|nr:methyltransferase [Fundicoccus culcitae]UUX33016.1 methyltransferase [Fundicoccus culcitae]
MSEQYFTHKPSSEERYREFTVDVAGFPLRFVTSEGVFSKNRMDYGSKFLVETFIEKNIIKEDKKILELGAGYGPVAITLAKAYPNCSVMGIEVNERAFELSKKNATLNQVEVNFEVGDATTYAVAGLDVDVVLTNPPIRAGKAVIQAFVNQAYKALVLEGELWVVVQKKQGAPSMQSHMQAIFGNVEKLKQDKGYWILKSQKTSD